MIREDWVVTDYVLYRADPRLLGALRKTVSTGGAWLFEWL